MDALGPADDFCASHCLVQTYTLCANEAAACQQRVQTKVDQGTVPSFYPSTLLYYCGSIRKVVKSVLKHITQSCLLAWCTAKVQHCSCPSPCCKTQVGVSWGESGLGELRAGRRCTLSKQHLLSKVIGSDLEGAVKGSVDPHGLRKQ